MSSSLSDSLRAGLDALGLELDAARQDQLLAYLQLIAKWTRVYNLTAVRDPAEMLTHHLLDSLAVIAPLRREVAALQEAGRAGARPTVLDVGSGAGLPGVVIAICCPDLQVSCVDTVAKKATFIQQAALELKLPNLRGVHARVESLDTGWDVVVSRAFASLVDFTTWSRAALKPGGVWMALKGRQPDAEVAALPPDVAVFHVEQIDVPGLDAQRCIVWLRPAAG
ncbi:MAG: 16S rRNA (guanine(527)-N(7))-methyltransferase RsmG [Burkholderiaceae bacterium]|nr:16S rRNA (guanine(527)-N(7))-methyltransferase RsmG [Burkholderiaceae bacterium]